MKYPFISFSLLLLLSLPLPAHPTPNQNPTFQTPPRTQSEKSALLARARKCTYEKLGCDTMTKADWKEARRLLDRAHTLWHDNMWGNRPSTLPQAERRADESSAAFGKH